MFDTAKGLASLVRDGAIAVWQSTEEVRRACRALPVASAQISASALVWAYRRATDHKGDKAA